MDDLEELKRRKLMELQRQLQEEALRQEQLRQVEEQKRLVLKSILTPEARSRLMNIKMARPEFAAQVEALLIQLAQTGQVKQRITDAQLKEILRRLTAKKRDIKIRRL
ncbi:MAG: DNA-binding protein [Euryarchaeota archaeon]|nr:DNA-binding protein [Euryarchaeota archaeon]